MSKAVPPEDNRMYDFREGKGEQGEIDMGQPDTEQSHDNGNKGRHYGACHQSEAEWGLCIDQEEGGGVGPYRVNTCRSEGDHS